MPKIKLSAEQEKDFDQDPAERKAEMFADWQKENPTGTREVFEEEWKIITAVFGE